MEILSILLAAFVLFVATILFALNLTFGHTAKAKYSHLSQCSIPNGNFWLPWLGESLQFFRQSPDQFYRERRAKYGDIYLSHILGSPTIMVSSPEDARFILATRHKSFKASYPPSIDKVLNHPFWEGDFHQQVRRIIVARMVPEALRSKIPEIDNLAKWTFSSWSQHKTIITHQETRKFAFHVILAIACSMVPCAESLKMLDDYDCVSKGAISMPINLPGTAFHSALKRSKVILESIMQTVCKREEEVKKSDILGSLLESRDANGEKLSLEQIQNVLMTLLFAGHETTAVFLVWLVKFLTENPHILQKVQEEQNSIKKNKDEPLCFEHLTKMTYTLKVVYETLRLANVAPFSPREILEDIEHKGYLFPKGYKVQVYYRHFHLNPQFYPEPYKFDPSRFEKPTTPSVYTPFGNGLRLCPGNELVKVEALIFIHHMVTNFRWEVASQDKRIQHWPTPRPKNGYAIIASHLHNGGDEKMIL